MGLIKLVNYTPGLKQHLNILYFLILFSILTCNASYLVQQIYVVNMKSNSELLLSTKVLKDFLSFGQFAYKFDFLDLNPS